MTYGIRRKQVLVSKAIDELKKFDPNSDVFITWFDKVEFETEYYEWNDNQQLDPPLNDDEWEGIVEGTTADDRIYEAIMESMRFDFQQLKEQREKLKEQDIEQDIEQELWEE